MESIYQTLTARALRICQFQTPSPNETNPSRSPCKRTIISISGAPGSGKSTIARTVVSRLNALSKTPFAITLPMDGFHYPKKQLDLFPDAASAHARRGAHWTFDACGVLQLVKALAMSQPSTSTSTREVIYAPDFDHAVGDPVEGRICVSGEISVVLLEGSYLAYGGAGVWTEIGDYVHESWFVEVEEEVARRRVARRHLRTGVERTMEGALRRADENDLRNGRDVCENLIKPDLVVRSVDESESELESEDEHEAGLLAVVFAHQVVSISTLENR
ncbi:P-loop containing nucleoside triphosphate hydrolase protein [Aspergillus sclerotiicarbonarius CBS 121057]|uniref:P-loop containing nucleoside triphosphate hydrolase protein n=1 Tax=Aspergillus sclerotiicarbonarius (strain CBS 121057 / IBT 28362) TaxID=1448318 RepID=A0A319FGL9_ASPSB|nr:P-loop containing nucleoside triphosphate hydrolase protein [Aspergillus sclerotiicarbonarius CBS 121057]